MPYAYQRDNVNKYRYGEDIIRKGDNGGIQRNSRK
jgi:hypothetical protein